MSYLDKVTVGGTTYDLRDTVILGADAGLTSTEQANARANLTAEERQATQVIPSDGGYVSATVSATSVAVDSEGVPTTTGSDAYYKHYFASCAPGDFVTVKTGSPGTNLRPCMFLGAAADGVRPILSKPVSSSKLAVFRAPENAEMVVFQSGTSALTSLNWFYIGAKLDVALADIFDRLDEIDAALIETDTRLIALES